MNLIRLILLFQLINLAIFQIEIDIKWNKYIYSNSLMASSKNIKSLNGIESFNYLNSIDLSKNKIERIDSLKSLTSLETLRFSENKII